MLGRRNLVERIDRLEEMILDKNWRDRNLEKRIEALESKLILKDIKEVPKRKPGRPRKNEASNAKKK